MNGLTFLFFYPLVAALFFLLCPIKEARFAKKIAMGVGLLWLAGLLVFQNAIVGKEIDILWIPALNIHFHLSVDPLSFLFLLLTGLVVFISLCAVRSSVLKQSSFFFFLVFLLQGLLVGFFAARDLALFTLFWEAMLLPIYFLIGIWGKEGARQAALKFLIYMFAGSVFLIAAVLALYFAAAHQLGEGTFSFQLLAGIAEASPFASWIFFAFVLAFAVKVPLFPFHAWLPESYTRASSSGTILLSAILSKAGVYGLVRIVIAFFPNLLQAWSPLLLGLAIAGVLYGGMAACVQKDFKRLLAYSSFSHVNFILVGLMVWQGAAQTGALLQAFNHGVTIAGLFLAAGWLEIRLQGTEISLASGLAKWMPRLCWLTLIFVLSNVALPGTNNFVGEILIFFGLFQLSPWLAAVLGLSVIMAVVYMLRFMQKVYFETPVEFKPEWKDIGQREWLMGLPLVVLIFWMGIYPNTFLPLVHRDETFLVQKTEVLNYAQNDSKSTKRCGDE